MQQSKKDSRRALTKNLLALARSYGTTDEEICNITGARRSTLWRWDSGETDMTPRRMAKLAAAMFE